MSVTLRVPQRRRPHFHPLPVMEVDRLTDDSVAVAFTVPDELREVFAFEAGQHVTVRRHVDGEEIRRSYSISSTPSQLQRHGTFRIGVRLVPDGVFSTFANAELAEGHAVDVMPPLGHFTTAFDPGRSRHYAAIAAGSGITPVLSLLGTALETEPHSRFTLLYGNRTTRSVMFLEELADYKDRYTGRLRIVHVLSREPQDAELLSGRLEPDRLRGILDALLPVDTVDEWFLCGPFGLVTGAREVLAERGATTVHVELFHIEDEPVVRPSRDEPPPEGPDVAEVTILLDGRASTFTMRRSERVLDRALIQRPELPYACRGGVCSTCRAKLVEGEVTMARNYALEPDELSAGYVLTCQSSPVTDKVVVDYDA